MQLENEATGAQQDDVNGHYLAALNRYTDVLERAIVSSHSATGLDAGQRRYWGSVLFTRQCTISVSILWLCPRSKVNPDGTHWDFSSIASLARNVFECALQFFYLATEPVSDDEWRARLKIMQLHDCMERFRMFQAFDANDTQLKGFQTQADELRAILGKNAYFSNLPQKLREALLKGERSSILTQDEILSKMGQLPEKIRGYYRFLSSHAHSFPLGFYRTGEKNRGHGVENAIEKGYIASTLEFCADTLNRSTDDFQKSFEDIISFSPATYDWNALKTAPSESSNTSATKTGRS